MPPKADAGTPPKRISVGVSNPSFRARGLQRSSYGAGARIISSHRIPRLFKRMLDLNGNGGKWYEPAVILKEPSILVILMGWRHE